VFNNMAEISVWLGDFAHAAATIDELEDLEETANQSMTQGWASSLRGLLAYYQGNLGAARRSYGEALGEKRRLNRVESTGAVLRDLAWVSLAAEEYDDAEERARQAVDIGRRAVNPGLMTEGYTLVARATLRQGLSPVASQAAIEALDIAADTGNTWSLALVLATVAQLAWATGDASSSAVLHGGAETLRTRIGFVHTIPEAREFEDEYLQVRTALGSDAFNMAWQSGASLSRDDLTERARTALTARAIT
jgi:tetratricopeptide (TPR) repeat protein